MAKVGKAALQMRYSFSLPVLFKTHFWPLERADLSSSLIDSPLEAFPPFENTVPDAELLM